MDAIKKKMVAMKMEKENALDRAEQLEQKLRETEEAKAKVKYRFQSFIVFYKFVAKSWLFAKIGSFF